VSERETQAVLVIEDEEAIRRGLCDVLAFRGYAPEAAARGDEGLERALAGAHALLILDVMLPGMNGFDVCRKVRETRPLLPILMLTARGSEEDVLRGFGCGSDDYVTKPFRVAELMARVEALVRRAQGARRTEVGRPSRFALRDWEIDAEAREARRGDEVAALSRRDLEILSLFAREAGRIVGRRQLLREIWGFANPERIETRSVDMHVAKLRKKLGAPGDGLIETVRGEGYRFRG
jgi:DNA-binding response OmpR family regulator